MSELTVRAPAKLNLTLEVLGKRPDGFHEIRSVFQAVNLCDELRFRQSGELVIKSVTPGWDAEKSLVARAVSLLQESAGGSYGVEIEVVKNIPLVSGLGGDSSDAAAVLRGLNELWELKLPNNELLELAARLGSDVPFFLSGGTALAEGRGEKLTPFPSLPPMWAVLVKPDTTQIEGKTGRLYAALREEHYTDGRITQRLVTTLRAGGEITDDLLFNTFENVAYGVFGGLDVYKEHLLKLGAPHVRLAGSGPALFTLLQDKATAEDIYTRCKDQGMKVFLAGVV
ncbi:4-(cytidine 5'-diphospho)-2-C-methyl-D-erythritol kinase [Chloroflexota bacterium]